MPERIPQENRELPAEDAPLEERSRFFDVHPERIKANFGSLNNMHFHLPGGRNRQMGEFLQNLDERPTERHELMSEKRFRETYREFYAEIDRAIAEAGSSIDEFVTLNRRIADTDATARQRAGTPEGAAAAEEKAWLVQELYEKSVGVYQKLRAYGYNHYDLVQ